MAEFKLGRIRFVWKGDWTAENTYYQDDVVALGGKIYICVLGHVSQTDFFSDLDVTPTKWNLVSDGQTWKGDWTTSTDYVYGDIVKYGAGLYIANTVHTSAATEAEGLEADQSNWDDFVEGLYWKGDWTTNTKYSINDIIKYGGTTYVCNTTHTSAANESDGLEVDQAKWDYFNQGLDFKSYWTEDTRYKVNDLVRYGSSIWIATTAHTSTQVFANDASKWEKFVEGFQFEGDWDTYRGYQPGDIVKYGGNQYVAILDHTGQVPSTATSFWSLFSEGISYQGEWGADSTNQDYRVGDLVKLGGFTYLCIADNNNQSPPNTDYWEKFTSGFDWRGEWLDDATYNEGDVVRYGDNSYICINSHISDGDDYSSGTTGAENSRPDLDLTGTYWAIMAVGTEQSVLTTKGDLVYYSGSAPQRLPIGRNGQVLSVNVDGLPEWEFLGDTDDVYYVAEHGVDSPAPEYGKSIDRPWRSIRYATQQVERGAKNRNAAKLLEINRRFIQREIVEWTDYQIANAIAPFTSDFNFDSFYCERDMGLIVDALIWDITHGGNVRSREAALSYVETATEIYTKGQEDETNASINYGLEVIEAVLNNTAPAANYQTLNGDNSTAVVEQYFDINLEVENVFGEITGLTKIITDAITAGNDRNIPQRLIRNTLIKVATGKYYEVLPIIVPAECCILGDELRSTNVQPRKASNGTLTPKRDVRFSYEAVNQMEKVVGDIVRGRAVTPTTGNTATQDQSWPYAETTVVAPQVEKLSRTIKRSIDRGIGEKIEAIYTPHYEMSNQDYGRSRDLFLANKEFIQAEIVAYLTSQFPDVRYSKTKCKQDVGLIMDSIAYDLTYGGNWQSVVAGQAYFNGSSGTLQIDSEEKAATLAAYAYLKELLQTTGRNITVTPTYQDPEVANDYTTVDVPQVNGIGGSAGASTVIGNLVDDVITVIEDGFANSPTITYPSIASESDAAKLKTAIDLVKNDIQEHTIDFINKNFGSFRYNSATCRRDLRNILTDVAFDVALGTNYNAIFNGNAYNRPNNAYNLQAQRVETVGAIRQARDLTVVELSDSTAITRTRGAFNEIVDLIDNGLGAADTLVYPTPASLPTTNADDAFNDIEANKAFIQAEIVAWIDDQITEFNITNPSPGSIWFNFSYDSTKCSRDVGYIVEAMKYDILYGGTMATTRIAESYFGDDGTAYPAGQGAQTAAAYDRLAEILDEIVREQDVTTSSGNAETQTKLGSAATSTEGNILLANMQIIEDVITAGNKDNLPAVTRPNLATLGVSATLQTEKTAIDDARPQIVLDTVQYISDTYNDFNYIHAKCSRDVGLIIDAFVYDYALETNFASIVSAYSYLRAPSVNVLKDQKTASLAAFEYAKSEVKTIIDDNSAEPNAYIALDTTWDWIDDTILSGNAEGGNDAVEDFEVFNAIRMLELNKDFITSEIQAHVDNWFTVGVSQVTANNSIIVSDTSMLKLNDPIKFAEYYQDSTVPVIATGLDVDSVYYVRDIVSDTEITVSEEPGGAEFALTAENSGFNFDHSKCRRDTGLIIDAVGYDLVLNTNYNQVTNGLAYARANASGVEAQLTETVAGITYAKGLAAALEDVAGDATALSRSNAAFDEIIDILENGSGNADTILWTVPSNATADQEKAKDNLQNNRSFLQTEVIAWITDNYPALSYDQAKCERDVGYIVDALTYDILYGGNTATIQAARAYFVGTQSQLGAGEQTATYLAYNYLQSIIDNIVTADNINWTKLGGATQDISAGTAGATLATKAQTLVGIIEQVIQDGDLDSLPGVETPNLSGLTQSLRDAQIAMQRNKDDIVIKTIRYLDDTYSTMFTLSIDYNYNKTLCARDIGEFIDAVKWDLQWPQQWKREYTNGITLYRPGCYKTKLASRAYVNAVIGSQEEDMYYMRNGTGLRMMTLDGLQGDLGPTNEYGTRRVTAGAYASLDPGWGPDDERVWITSRSPYLQNNTCFGYAATGQRIDGSLHNGGNDSMVSNDFTQVISDGIGAHILNNGRAELVSVFTYYSHIGYLAENGGRIRATNGNNSYGAFGSVAEGVDPEETAITGIVDNRTQYNATVAFINVDQDQIQAFEFSHAGNEYTEVEYEIFGAGDSEQIVGDEFRDGAVSQVRIIESPTQEAGGSGYLVVSNTAQTGDSTSLTLAATDGNLSTAYPGMRIQITGGAGQGLYGIVDTYNSGSKQATVIRESDGQAGWDHIVPGTPFVSPNSTSIYVIEPYASFTAPTKTSGDTNTLPSNSTWGDVVWVRTSNEYINLATETEADGTGATFDVIRNGSKYYLEINDGGSGFSRLDTLTIKGSNLNGVDDTHDITITVTTVNSVTGAIEDFDFVGHGRTGAFVAVGQGELRGVKSYDGITWDNMGFGGANDIYSVAVGENLVGIATGLLDDGSSTFKESATVAIGGSNAYYSTDLDTWAAESHGLGTANAIAFGNLSSAINRFIIIDDSTTDVAYSDNGGATWTTSSAALPATGYDAITFGQGKFVAVNSGTTNAAYSTNGTVWNAVTLPGTVGANPSVVWGNGRFVCLGGTNGIMYSLDGITWYENSLSMAATVTERKLAYGQGVFVITSDDTDEVQYSQDGLYWQSYTLADGAITGGFNAIAFGNPEKEGVFVIMPNAAVNSDVIKYAKIGATPRARTAVSNEQLFEVRLLEPGSGYTSAPTLTIVDPNNIDDVLTTVRLSNGAVANPTFISRGSGYTAASATVTAATSNGYADFFQNGTFIAVRRLTRRPVSGSNIEFDSLPGQYFKLVNTVSFLGDKDGSYTAFLQVSPEMSITDAPSDGDPIELRIRFSQVRLTGHDFLDIGTGNFVDSNYPNTPVNAPDQSKETTDSGGGRVFYTATDQDGNFRVGDLFSIEQATGVATLNADAFNIAGLQELTLGEVTLGGNSAAINEFSTDPFFTANSDTVVPTQRAVKAYIEAQIGGGGASLVVNSVTAGDIFVGSDIITTVSGAPINISGNINFTGTVLGLPLAYNYFLR